MAEPPKTGETLFAFTARSATGARQKGEVAALDLKDATQKLRTQGLYPIDLAPQTVKSPVVKAARARRRLTQRDKADFIARLAKLTESQITLDRALGIIAEGGQGPLPPAATALRQHIREGGSFVAGLQDYLGINDAATLALVRGAEVSGALPQALASASGILQQRLALVRRVGVGLVYPSLLMVIAILSIGLIMIAVIPQFRPLVDGRMDMVPFLGRMIFGISAALTALWPFLVFGLVAMVIALWVLHRRGQAVPLAMRLVARAPLVSGVILRNQVMIVLHSLGALLDRGVTLSEALEVVTRASQGGRLSKALAGVSRSVVNGEALSQSLARTGLVDSSAVEMVRIGEETGDLSGMVTRAANEMREAADRDLERFLALFQPALIILVGLIVGVSLYALFSAIVSVNAIAF